MAESSYLCKSEKKPHLITINTLQINVLGAYGGKRKPKNYFISIEKTTIFIAAKGNKLTFYLILLPGDLH